VAVTGSLGDDVVEALAAMVDTAEALPGTFKSQFTLTYWAGVTPPAEPWLCTVEGDILGDNGSTFSVLGRSAAEALRKASDEAWKRVPGP